MPEVPDIPKGLATRLGQYGTVVFFALGVAIYAFDLDVDWEALVAAGLAAVTAWTTISGRMLQSAAALRDAPFPPQLADLAGGVSGDLGDEDLDDELPDVAPEEDDLAGDFPDDPPEDPAPTPEGAVGGKPGMNQEPPS